MNGAGRPRVLVVDDNERARALVRLGLELEGLDVTEASTLAEGRSMLDDGFDGYVLDRQLPDGDGLTLIPELRQRNATGSVVIYSTLDPTDEPDGVTHVDKGDLPGVVAALGLIGDIAAAPPLAAAALVRDNVHELAADWRELCAWDPELPPETNPPVAHDVILAVADALRRPQPLGWGVDPVVEHSIGIFAVNVESVEHVIGELVCLREAITRRLRGQIPTDEIEETAVRLQMILERAMGSAAHTTAARLHDEAYVDPLTGLFNRRAFDRDVRREVSRAQRHRRQFTVVLTDVDGLKITNDTQGHNAGDLLLRSLAVAMSGALRAGDAAYRVGGDEFTMLLTDTDASIAESVVERLRKVGAPAFGWGAACYPTDGTDIEKLLDHADRELIARRRAHRAGRTRSDL
jgi:diguanylate cyclase (GGDEF)-like protein